MTKLCDPVECSTILYRAILKKRFINKNADQWSRAVLPGAFFNAVTPGAFLPREKDNASVEYGISLHIADRSPEDYSHHCALDNWGVASLHVGRMRDIDLELIHDLDSITKNCIEWEERLHHCTPLGIPEWTETDIEARQKAEDIADLLSEQAYLRYDKTKTYEGYLASQAETNQSVE